MQRLTGRIYVFENWIDDILQLIFLEEKLLVERVKNLRYGRSWRTMLHRSTVSNHLANELLDNATSSSPQHYTYLDNGKGETDNK